MTENSDKDCASVAPGCSIVRLMLAEAEKRYEQRFVAQEEAIRKQEVYYDKRFHALNELRNIVTEVINKNVSRNEWDTRHQEIVNRVTALDLKLSALPATYMTKTEGDSHATNDLALHADIGNRMNEMEKRITILTTEKTEHKDIRGTDRANLSLYVGIAALVLSILLFLTRISPALTPILK